MREVISDALKSQMKPVGVLFPKPEKKKSRTGWNSKIPIRRPKKRKSRKKGHQALKFKYPKPLSDKTRGQLIKELDGLKKEFQEKGITSCELKFNNCWRTNTLGFAHRHKRNWYLGKNKELLWKFNQVILACNSCHFVIEYDKELTQIMFKKLRP